MTSQQSHQPRPASIDVRRHDLGALQRIGSDAFTHWYVVGNRLPGLPYPLWYREIRPDDDLPPGVTPDNVRATFVPAVALRQRCSDADRAELDRRTDWSVALVRAPMPGGDRPDRSTEHGTVLGVLLPAVPDEFLVPSAGMGIGTIPGPGGLVEGRRALTMRDLCASDAAAAANGLDRSAVDDDLTRLALAAHLAHTIHLLHRNRIAYSDLTLGRVAIAGHPPLTMLMGCDPTVPLRRDAARSAVPARRHDLDPSRLALCIIRALAKGPGATQLTDPARVRGLLGDAGVGLLTRALGPPPAQRPSAEQILQYLGFRIRELAREMGVTDQVARPPEFDIAAQLRGRLPRLAVPDLPTVPAPRAAAPLPRRPLAGVDEYPPPRIELPPVELDLDRIGPTVLSAGAAAPGSTIGRTYIDANQQVGAALRDGLQTLRAAIDERLALLRPPTDLTTNRSPAPDAPQLRE
jgi:hypothetical protein